MHVHRIVKGCALAVVLASVAWAGRVIAMASGSPASGFKIVMSAAGIGESFVTSPPLAIGTAKFAFVAWQHENGTARGLFRMVRQRAGFDVDFTGLVTCMAVDPVTHRAWIGGIVVRNDSNDPNHTRPCPVPVRCSGFCSGFGGLWFAVTIRGERAQPPAQ
jgi:hypothetical protein